LASVFSFLITSIRSKRQIKSSEYIIHSNQSYFDMKVPRATPTVRVN